MDYRLLRLLESWFSPDPDAWKGGDGDPEERDSFDRESREMAQDAVDRDLAFPIPDEYLDRARGLLIAVKTEGLAQIQVLRAAVAEYYEFVARACAAMKAHAPKGRGSSIATMPRSPIARYKMPNLRQLDLAITEIKEELKLIATVPILPGYKDTRPQHLRGPQEPTGPYTPVSQWSGIIKQVADELITKESEKTKLPVRKKRKPHPPT